MRGFALSILLLVLTALAGPARAGSWLRAESPHFVVYGQGREADLAAYARMLEDYDAALRVIHGRPVSGPAGAKFSIYLVTTGEDFRRVFPEARAGIGGMYSVGYEEIFAVAVRTRGGWLAGPAGDHTVLHEYAHHFMHQTLTGAYPSWYVEGYAEYFAASDLGRTIRVGLVDPGRAYELIHQRWMPMAQVLAANASAVPSERLDAFYSQAWLLTHYVQDDSARRARFKRYLAAWRAGRDPAGAWEGAFGQSPEDLDRALQAYMREKMKSHSVRRSWPAAAVSVEALSAGAGAVILETQALRRDPQAAPSSAVVKAVNEAAARWPDDPFVARALARVKLAGGERAAGEAILLRLAGADPKDAESRRLLAVSLMSGAGDQPRARRAAYEAAKRLMDEALIADPDGWQTLYRYAQSRANYPDYLDGAAMKALLRAAELAPQVPGIRITAARLAIAKKDPSAARTLLEPIAGDPRIEEAAKVARDIIRTLP